MLLSDYLETRYSPARDAGHPGMIMGPPGMIAGPDRAHWQGIGAGLFENFMSEGRGQQPLWPSAEINNVGTRVLSQGDIREGERGEKKR